MQPGKDFRVRKTKITRYIFQYITSFELSNPLSFWVGLSPALSPQLSSLKLCDVLMVEPLLHLEHLQRCTEQQILDEEKSKHISSPP
jgi:hypothetical protein